jgi:hypothetical protein
MKTTTISTLFLIIYLTACGGGSSSGDEHVAINTPTNPSTQPIEPVTPILPTDPVNPVIPVAPIVPVVPLVPVVDPVVPPVTPTDPGTSTGASSDMWEGIADNIEPNADKLESEHVEIKTDTALPFRADIKDLPFSEEKIVEKPTDEEIRRAMFDSHIQTEMQMRSMDQQQMLYREQQKYQHFISGITPKIKEPFWIGMDENYEKLAFNDIKLPPEEATPCEGAVIFAYPVQLGGSFNYPKIDWTDLKQKDLTYNGWVLIGSKNIQGAMPYKKDSTYLWWSKQLSDTEVVSIPVGGAWLENSPFLNEEKPKDVRMFFEGKYLPILWIETSALQMMPQDPQQACTKNI